MKSKHFFPDVIVLFIINLVLKTSFALFGMFSRSLPPLPTRYVV